MQKSLAEPAFRAKSSLQMVDPIQILCHSLIDDQRGQTEAFVDSEFVFPNLMMLKIGTERKNQGLQISIIKVKYSTYASFNINKSKLQSYKDSLVNYSLVSLFYLRYSEQHSKLPNYKYFISARIVPYPFKQSFYLLICKVTDHF